MPMECFRSNGKDQQCCGLPSQGSRRSDISTNDFISAVCTDLSVKAIFAYFLTVLEPASRAALDTPKLGGQYAVRLPAAQAGWFRSRCVSRGSLRNHPALRACPYPNLGGQIARFLAFHRLRRPRPQSGGAAEFGAVLPGYRIRSSEFGIRVARSRIPLLLAH